MDVVSSILGVSMGVSLGVIIWLAYTAITAKGAERDALVALANKSTELSIANFKLAQITIELDRSEKTVASDAKEIEDAINAPPSPELAPNDVAGRLRELRASWTAANPSTGIDPTIAGTLPANPAPSGAKAGS